MFPFLFGRQLQNRTGLGHRRNPVRGSSGRQSSENEKYKVSWTYHPDDGLKVTYEKKEYLDCEPLLISLTTVLA